MALETVGEITAYLGDFEQVLAVGNEAAQVADDAGHEMLSAGMKNYQAIAHLQMGDAETAIRLLLEGDEVLSHLGELFMRTWNIATQAIIAMMQDRVDDAIDLHILQAELAREVAYLRAEALALQGLGQAYTRSGDLDGASDALLESLEKFEQMGLVVDMAALMVMLARVRAEKGQAEQAVELLAGVLADPSRDQLSLFEQVPIGEAAVSALEPLEAELDPDVYAAAHARGGTISLDVMVKQLLSGT
jgi:ATP/maltotriose-dependent transcriptional regulator MalT